MSRNKEIFLHKNIGFVNVVGSEAEDFLQSIVTTNVAKIDIGNSQRGALLTPQGRILIDMMIYRLDHEHFLIRTNIERVEDLFKRLKQYRLRRQVDIFADSNFQLALSLSINDQSKFKNSCIFVDPWSTKLGAQILYRDDLELQKIANNFGFKIGGDDLSAWNGIRIASGVPEGPIDLTPGRALMLEAGLDQLGAVDFDKGCYVGQEVTARTHYRGLVKRRLIPLKVSGEPPLPNSNIYFNGNQIGLTKTSAPYIDDLRTPDFSICLALLKLSDINLISMKNSIKEGLSIDDNAAELAIPSWMLPFPAQKKI